MTSSPDAVRVTPLSRVLRMQMDAKGWALSDVHAKPGGREGLARSTASHHLNPQSWLKTMIRPETLDKISTAFHLPPALVYEAASLSTEEARAQGMEVLIVGDANGSPASLHRHPIGEPLEVWMRASDALGHLSDPETRVAEMDLDEALALRDAAEARIKDLMHKMKVARDT